MWNTKTLWFEIAVVMSIFAFGSILFGHFEDHKPKWQRVLKVILVSAIFVALAATVGRIWAFGFLSLPLLGAVVAHLWWLPKHGINGWTAEPKDKYYTLIKAKK
ncbi:MAG: hypothetical protein JST84_19570 [Acidobacteria bacterium]|nr:hypothetical protein [Acidobacteriota bacterium]